MDSGGHDAVAFGAGKTNPYEDIGAFRAQDITNLGGKVLRLNPANGHGYASNPFADSDLTSARSRVWCYGLRNPFRFTIKPGTGVADTAAANPGTLVIGDVGYNTWEEMNMATTGGMNFGWPCYEGVGGVAAYQAATPAHNGCGSIGTATNPSTARTPLATWNHSVGTNSIPVGLVGNCSIGGAFYTGTQYPAQYRDQYVFADYGANWLKLATLDVNNNLVSVSDFIGAADGPVDVEIDPLSGDIFYTSIVAQQVRRIRYTSTGTGNTPPVAAVAASPLAGSTPLTVSFSSAGSFDANGDSLRISWVFGDGTGSTLANPTHIFTTPGVFNVQLTVSDGRGGTDIKYITVNAGASVIPFPSTAVLDGFNRANGIIGSSWMDQTTLFSINTNMLAPAGSVGSTEWSTAFGPDQEAFVTLGAFPGASLEQNLMLKTQGSAWSAGHIEVSLSGGNSSVSVYTLTPGLGWTNYGTITGVTFVTGDQFGARALGNGSVQIFRNAAVIGAVSVASWAYSGSGGRIGISYDNAAGTRFDNFGGGNVVSNVNTPPTASILSPANGAFYYSGQRIPLTGSSTDAQTPDSLTYAWKIDLYHNNHAHPGFYNFTAKNDTLIGENLDDGTGVHLHVQFYAKDPPGAVSDTAAVDLWPEIDLTASAVTVVPASPTAGQPAHYSFALNNSGRMPAPISHWVLRAGNTVVAQGDTLVPASSSDSIAVDATLPIAGTFALRLVADTTNVVRELSESNNASVSKLIVAPVPGNNAPVAIATGSPQIGTVSFSVNFVGTSSYDPDGNPISFGWTFGDGGTATGSTASHSYTTAGNYTAILTVTDSLGAADTASVVITANAPAANFPQTPILDNFNRANGAPGANWIDQASLFAIATNALAPKTGKNYVEWGPTVFGANQEAYVKLGTVSTSSPEQNLMLKSQGNTWSGGHIEVSYNAPGSKVVVYTFTPPTTWATRGTLSGVTFASGQQFGARALSNGNVQVYRNGALLGTVSVAGWAYAAAGGHIGLSVSNATTTRFDDFGGGDVSGALAMGGPQPGGQSSLAQGVPVPEVLALSSAFPNPTHGGVNFALELPRETNVEMKILDIQGREIWSLPGATRSAGRTTLAWNGEANRGTAGAGVYLARVRVGSTLFLRRFAIIR